MTDKNNIENAVRTLIDSAVSKANESVPGVMEASDTGFDITIHVNKIHGKINMYADDQNDLYFENLGNGMFNRSGYADFDDFHDGEPEYANGKHDSDDVADEFNDRAINGNDLADSDALSAWNLVIYDDNNINNAFNALRNLSYCGFTNITITFVA